MTERGCGGDRKRPYGEHRWITVGSNVVCAVCDVLRDTVSGPVDVDLNQLADEVGDVLREAEKVFRGLSHGVMGRAQLPSGGALVFEKYGGRWQLRVNLGQESPQADPWSQPVAMRLEMIRALPELHRDMMANRSIRLDDMRSAIEQGREFLGTLKDGV